MVYRHRGFQDPSFEQEGNIFKVYLNDIEASSFLTPRTATQSNFLRLLSHRSTQLAIPGNIKPKLSPFNENEAINALQEIRNRFDIQPKIKKAKSLTLKQLKKRMLFSKVRQVRRMLMEKYSIQYICSIVGFTKVQVINIRSKIRRKARIGQGILGRPSKVNEEQFEKLEDLFRNKLNGYLPAKTLLLKWRQLCNWPNDYLSISAFRNILKKRLGLSFKRNGVCNVRGNERKGKQLRYEFVLAITKQIILNKRLIFIDEAGFNLEGHKNYGWSEKGAPLPVNVMSKSVNYSVLGAMSQQGLIGFMIVKGPVDSIIYCAFMSNLINNLIEQDFLLEETTFVMDNARCHKLHLMTYIQPYFHILWTPPYTPQVNPIELMWAQFRKNVFNRESFLTEDALTYAIAQQSQTVTELNCQGFFKHSIRFYEKCLHKENIN